MPGLVPGIHVRGHRARRQTWMAGTSPAITEDVEYVAFARAYCFSIFAFVISFSHSTS
jgi:hypothetical protein